MTQVTTFVTPMKKHQTFRLDEKVIEKATKYATDNNRSLSNVYATAVIEFLKSKVRKINQQ